MTGTDNEAFNDPTAPVTTTDSGSVRGRRRAGVASFLGVPYAAPPVGELRFAAPTRPQPWDGVGDATAAGPASVQEQSAGELVPKVVPATDEDCLTVNVWTPAVKLDEGLPVIVWLHGGGFAVGSASARCYGGEELARRGAVVVGVNYRLGALGYLYLPEEAAVDGIRANFGLLDQMRALEWVRDNVAAFGGDPARVTVVGQSAGAYSILALGAMERARPLFHRAVLQSAPFAVDDHDIDVAEDTTSVFLKAAGIAGGGRAELLGLSAAQILRAQQETFDRFTGTGHLDRPFVPVVDGETLTVKPAQAAFEGSLDSVDLLVGCTAEERLFFPQDGSLSGSGREQARRIGAQIDDLFTEGVFRLGEHRALVGRPARLFWWRWPSGGSEGLGACHCAELPFLFGDLDQWADSAFLRHGTADDHAYLVDAVQGAWVSFSETGDPDPDGTLGWTPYTVDGRETLVFDVPVEQTSDPRDGRVR
ncbi:carboxylesterase/lipase family protein [Streptomyces chartreusis]|uniref:carboxylesterase/lipase family protein n=1 Tax=Streptomyces chartreusis TaxID=1969 RepID=UPI0035DE0E65